MAADPYRRAHLLDARPPLASGGHTWARLPPVPGTPVLWWCVRCHVTVPDHELSERTWLVTAGRWCPELLAALPAVTTPGTEP